VAADTITAIGRTNDAILYGGHVTLWVRGQDRALKALIPRIPSCASPEHGRPFAEIFDRHNQDFYAIDPQLFAPARITLVNLDTGSSYRFGRLWPDILARSFGTK
jgi:methenyltetrahydromethanopterin cyclohydrolase